MKKENKFFSFKIYFFFLLFLCIFSINSATVHEINQSVDGTSDYKKVEFSGDQKTLNHYFKYTFTTIPSSKVSAIRFQFDQFNDLSLERNKVYCTFVDASTSDSELINAVGLMDETTSSCKGTFTYGFYNGIIKHDNSKKKLAVYLITLGTINFTARLYLRISEYILPVVENTVFLDESYSLIPVTIIISHFREKASKVLFFSYTRELQMYYTEEKTPYPERLFFGNIMSVYTNPNMVRQKYKNADTMVLLTKPFGAEDMIGEQFQFQVKFFASDYLLDYYMGSNLEGRSKNTPLAINMTECENPYYVILNYNVPEKQTSLYIDEIYGKIKSISVAPELTSPTWEKMVQNDMKTIDIDTRKYVLPANSVSHIDVYKVECDVPLLLNFYYIDESASIPELDYGHVAITTLKSYKSVSLPFASGVVSPELTIEVFNPVKDPFVILDDGQNEKIITKNSVIRSMPFTTSDPIVLKERNGDSNSRIIIKVGYNTGSWREVSENVVYSLNLNMYVFSFPAGDDKYNYTYALLKTSGTNSEDNVKYCYGTNIGSAVIPSNENCYRVSHDNSYTIKVLNPLVMYKDYNMEEELTYYVSLRPTDRGDSFEINADLTKYDTTERNFERIGNNLVLTNGKENTVLTSPEDKDEYILVQIQSCDNSKLSFGVYDGYNNKQIVSDIEIPAGKKHYYTKYKNTFFETEVKLSGNSGTKVYVKHTGISNSYTPSIKDSYPLSFNQDLNQLIVENPLKTSERMNYTIYVGRQGELSNQGLTLCSFAEIKSTISKYNQTFVSFSDKTTFNINFNKLGLSKGDTFEAIAFIEQEPNSAMSFITEVLTGTVGEIETKSVTEINTEDTTDPDYVYVTKTAQSSEMTYYFSYLPSKVFNVSVGALRIEVESDETGPFNRIACAFVDEGADANSMVEAVEEIASQYNSYCVGGRSRTNGKIYNFLFRYSYTKDESPKPRRLVIKLNNAGEYNGNFNIYVRKGDNVYLEHTDFYEQKEYGKQEEFKKSIIPYIIDLEAIRGEESQDDYISKILIYSQHLELQMYYLDSSEERNDPMLLFTGNILLVYTNLNLAEQKYHATKLILLSENLNGQEHSAVGITFRFHTKMFRSEDQIEYFVSYTPTGRTLNFPLSIEMNTCTSTNNKYYYILNYNQAEEERILYLDSVFGIMKNARIANEINAEKWDSLLTNSMTEITDYTFTLSEKSQHIDVIEIECTTPLLTNIYYNYKDQIFSGLNRGDIVVKNLGPQETFSFTLVSGSISFYYSISAFNSKENPDLTFSFDGIQSHHITENCLQIGILTKMPYKVSVENNKNTDTRFIFKIGYGVESEWIDEDVKNIDGKLYSSESQFVYKFPMKDNRRNFTNVVLDVKAMRKDSQELAENVKFCYSTSIGMAIDPSRENCYRTGAKIPYSLTFINPLIAPKNYKSFSDNYYVTITPFTQNEYISLGIHENKYDVEDRNLEGVNKILKLESTTNKSTILSIPEVITNTEIVVQLQACVASNQISYVNKNAYSGEVISTGIIPTSRNDFYYTINNNLMETEIEFTGSENDMIFVKHTGITDYTIITQYYSSTFDKNENTVSIIKPIKDEKFRITVLVGRPGRFSGYSLCKFAEKKESEYSTLADYAKTFIAESSNTITHFIDFRSFSYKQDEEFDLLVYAVQEDNSKLEFLYPIISGTVGEIKGITEISGLIDSNYVTQDFTQNRTTNYLFYDFLRNPIGDVASLKIINSEEGMRVNKVGCAFVKRNTEDADMVSAVNKAMMEGNSVCFGQTEKDTNGFDALINAKDVKNGYGRLVIQILYGFGESDKEVKKIKNGKVKEDGYTMTINIRTNGFEVDAQNSQYNEKEELTAMPYVFNLKNIRESQGEDYISKVMVYSSTREMQMFYIGDNGAPTELFSGNIMLVYTNPDVINEKYHGANIMILLTDSLSNSGKQTIGEVFRFKTYFFKSDNTMQYYVSPNPDGRLLNKPTLIEMNSCDVPYYYILNYNFPEEDDRVLHIDNVFGEINTIKIANKLNNNDWYDLIREMEEFSGSEYLIQGQTDYHIDVIEVTCNVPSLLNIYYTDENNPNYSNLGLSDISIINLSPNQNQRLTLKSNLDGDFIYTFNILLEAGSPDILITFEDEEEGMRIKENGVYTKNSKINYEYITVSNKKLSGNTKTKIIFKFGYSIENSFDLIRNNIYHLNKTANLFAYKFNTGEDRLNTTSVDLRVSTSLENVKFCYTTNLGSFVEPSSQNCYRVGRTNSYTISVLNPYLMYKNYYAGDNKNVMGYYVSFRTENISHNITIYPSLNNYKTLNRNLESYPNTITITKNGSTILTSPKNNMLFVQIQSCTEKTALSYEFKNAYNSSSLNIRDQITQDKKYYFVNVPNIKLDTELALETKDTADVFIKHVGLNEKYQPIVNQIEIAYDGSKTINFTQPINNEEFKYTIYLDKQGNLEKQGYTLCSFTKNGKFAYYSTTITSKDKVVELNLDFNSKDLKGYEKFDLLILAEQTNNGKLMILSDIFQSVKKKKSSSSSNLVLVIVIVILTVLLVGGGITAFILLRRYKLKPAREKLNAKETSLAEVDNKNEKMITSTATQNEE